MSEEAPKVWLTGEEVLERYGLNPWSLGEPGNGNPIRSKLIVSKTDFVRVWLLDDVEERRAHTP